MEDLKQLVEDFIDYTSSWSITDTEWYWNIECVRKSNNTKNENITWEEFERARREEILYEFLYNIDGIKYQMEIDLTSGYGTEMFYNDSIEMEKKIQNIFPTFKIDRF